MKFLDMIKYSGNSLKTQKARTFLTVLGILIGISAIVALTSLGNGFEDQISSQLSEGLNTKVIQVSKKSGGFSADPEFKLFVNDTQNLMKLEQVDMVLPILSKPCQIKAFNRSVSLTVYGVNFENYTKIYSQFEAEKGSIPKNSLSNISIIGHSLHDPFDNGTFIYNLGEELVLNWTEREGTAFKTYSVKTNITGILSDIEGFPIGGSPSNFGIYMPIDVAIEVFDIKEVSTFVVVLDDDSEEVIDSVSKAIEDLFYDNVNVNSPKESLQTIQNVFSTIEGFLAAIAGISLIVAGIGIMNIMIVSVMERTREIGIIKSLGMKNRTILTIFLIESFLIGLIGSIAGIGTGWLFANLLGSMLGGGARAGGAQGGLAGGGASITPLLTIDLVFQAMFFGIFVSVIFGLYPAWRAARMHPVEALRYE